MTSVITVNTQTIKWIQWRKDRSDRQHMAITGNKNIYSNTAPILFHMFSQHCSHHKAVTQQSGTSMSCITKSIVKILISHFTGAKLPNTYRYWS